MRGVLVVVIALWAFPDVTHNSFFRHAAGKLTLFLRERFNL